MNTHCPICGVRYKENSEIFTVDNQPEYYTEENHNVIFILEGNNDMCYWCADNIPSGIIQVVKGKAAFYFWHYDGPEYTIKNYKEYPALKERIKSLSQSALVSSCPRCNSQKFKETYSEWAQTNIVKCVNCGWC